MIRINKSATADSRSCDWTQVTKEQLKASSVQHVGDVKQAIGFLKDILDEAASNHDFDKLTDLDTFHANFATNFKERNWLDNHVKINRHHLLAKDGVPEDVNLLDVLEMIVDCTMAGMARSGDVYPMELSKELVQKAVDNTVALLKKNTLVD